MEAGVHNPYDRIAKEFAEEAPLLFLRLLGLATPGDEILLEPLRAETAPPVKITDYVAALRVAGSEPLTFHVEFLVHYRDEVPSNIARYGGSLAMQYQRPVKSILLLMKAKGVPTEVPAFGEYAIGETRMIHPFRTVRLWELDPKPILDEGNPALLPWALAMNLAREEAAKLGAIVAESGNDSWIWRFSVLGSLRYDKEELRQMLGGPRMGLMEAIIEGSSLFQHEREKGRTKGLSEGEALEARRLLRVGLSRRHPGLDTMPEIDAINDKNVLEHLLFDHVMAGEDRSSVEQAILAAARP